MSTQSTPFITPDALLAHWQGHRRLTRRVIDAFPEDKLFSFSVGGMRPFGALALEMVTMAVPMVRGAISGDWSTSSSRERGRSRSAASLGREHRAARRPVAADPAAAVPGDADGLRSVHGRAAQPDPLRHRQRDPSPRSGLRVPPRARIEPPAFYERS